MVLYHVHSLLKHRDVLILLIQDLLACVIGLSLVSLLDWVAHELVHSFSPFIAQDVVCLLKVFLSFSHLCAILVVGATKFVKVEARAHLRQTESQLGFHGVASEDILGIHLTFWGSR